VPVLMVGNLSAVISQSVSLPDYQHGALAHSRVADSGSEAICTATWPS
jgi:hypothetical protein